MIKTVGDLIREYNRRIGESHFICDSCSTQLLRHRNFKIQTCHVVTFVPGTDFDQLPDGWTGVTCPCGQEYPEIKYDKIERENPCECDGCKREKENK